MVRSSLFLAMFLNPLDPRIDVSRRARLVERRDGQVACCSRASTTHGESRRQGEQARDNRQGHEATASTRGNRSAASMNATASTSKREIANEYRVANDGLRMGTVLALRVGKRRRNHRSHERESLTRTFAHAAGARGAT